MTADVVPIFPPRAPAGPAADLAGVAAALASEDRQVAGFARFHHYGGIASTVADAFFLADNIRTGGALLLTSGRAGLHIELDEARARRLAASLLAMADAMAARPRAPGSNR